MIIVNYWTSEKDKEKPNIECCARAVGLAGRTEKIIKRLNRRTGLTGSLAGINSEFRKENQLIRIQSNFLSSIENKKKKKELSFMSLDFSSLNLKKNIYLF